jgi:catechol-2,3-dioxygenase
MLVGDTHGLEDRMNFHGVVINVSDLDRSIAFYRQVLGFTLLSREEQLAVVGASGSDRSQAIVLRAFGNSPLAGAGHIGLRAFTLEADSPDQLQRIESELESRKLLVTRREHSEWTAVVGRDPEGVTVVVTWHPGRTTEDGWKVLDDFLYGIGE